MSISAVTNALNSGYIGKTSNQNSKKTTDSANNEISNQGVVYEPGSNSDETVSNSSTNKNATIDYSAVVQQLKSAQAAQTERMQNLVNSLLTGQADKYNTLSDFFNDIANGKIKVDPQIVEQAKQDIDEEEGEWGVEKTSNRLVEMARALSGGDSTMADKMINAVKKGLSAATKSWGGELPSICSKTVDTTIKKLEAWRDGIEYKKEDKKVD